MEKHRPFLMRGKQVANVCANFVVTGLKEDNNTKPKMGHSPKSSRSALFEMVMRSKLRGVFLRHIYPLVQNEFGWLFEPVIQYLNEHKVKLYAHYVSGVTAGKLFWLRSHTDPDVWYTVLVCIGYGRGVESGGDLLKCHHCNVLMYNPTLHH
jgi:hypothetical protein